MSDEPKPITDDELTRPRLEQMAEEMLRKMDILIWLFERRPYPSADDPDPDYGF
jgi:hypothetical protein